MWADRVVSLDVSVDPPFSIRYRVVSPQIDLFILQGAPETLNENGGRPLPLEAKVRRIRNC